MFIDGITYASIARNLAEGRGSFWSPFYTATLYPRFHQHPALGLWLQSLWFRVLGDHLLVERAYAFAAAIATALLIAVVWRQLNIGSGGRHGDWLPVLLWILIPVVSWTVVGNMLETTMAVFTTGAVAALVQSMLTHAPAAAYGWASLSGLCIGAAVLTKGPVGLFPLAAAILFPVDRGGRAGWRGPIAQWVTAAALGTVLWTLDVSRDALEQYLHDQLFPVVGHPFSPTIESFTILKVLFQGVLLPLAIIALAIIIGAGFVSPSKAHRRKAVRLTLLGLAGTLPIVVSSKQMGHYLVPAVPFFALATGVMLFPTVIRFAERMASHGRRKIVHGATGVIVLGTVVAAFVPALERDPERLADLAALAPAVPRGRTISICADRLGDWGLHAWFERLYHVSLDGSGSPLGEWFLRTSQDRPDCLPSPCMPMTDPQRDLLLMRCRMP
jgi:4-amino-4-deoxy-L-arabinose transferase-like glycosyltransferase